MSRNPAPGNHGADPHARRAAQLRRSGRLSEAIAPLREVVRLDPANANAHYDLGLTYLKCGRHAEAIESLQRAVMVRPSFADAQYNLGVALEHAGRDTEALKAYGKAVNAAPRHADALRQLGHLLQGANNREAASRCFARASAAAADPVQRRLDESRRLMTLEKFTEAETCLRQTVSLAPGNAVAHRLLGHVLSVTGQFADAAAHFDRALALSPEEIAACYDLATARKMTEADRPLIARMQKVLEWPGLPEKLLISLHFALGKTFDDLRDYPAAMRHFDAGNSIKARTEHLDRAACAHRFNTAIAIYGPGSFPGLGGSPDETPLLILGMPRSGTTLTEQILSAHPDVGAGGELGFWDEREQELARQQSGQPSPGFVATAARDYLTRLRQIAPSAQRVTDKAPGNFTRIGLIHRVFPRARIIHCRRNPLDTCLSIYFTYFGSRQDYAYSKDDLAFYYRQYLRIMAHWRSVLPEDRFLEIDYESLIADREAGTRRLLAFCGLPWNDACMFPERSDRAVLTASRWQARQPVYTTSVARWRRYEPWLGPLRSLLEDGNAAQEATATQPPPEHKPAPLASPIRAASPLARVPIFLGALTQAAQKVEAAERLRQAMFAPPGQGSPISPEPAAAVARQPKLAEQQRRMGIRLIETHRIGEAVRALRDAVRFDPASAAAHHGLGVALMHNGQLEEATSALERAVALDPTLADGHKDLGIVLDRRGLEPDALAAYARAVSLAPRLAQVHRRMGELHRIRTEFAEAASCFNRAADLAPNTTEGRLDRVRALLCEANTGAAERVLRKTVALDPDNSDVRKTLADVLVTRGQFDEAITHFEHALTLDPRQVRNWLGIVSARRVTETDRPRIVRMQNALPAAEPNSDQRMSLHFALGKAHDDLGEYEEAMRHFDAANQIRARETRFDPHAFAQRVDRLMARFTPEFFASAQGFATQDETPLLIIGMPRSGSTLVEQILSSHPAIAGGDELPFWTRRGATFEARPGYGITPEAGQALAQEYLATLRAIGSSASRVTDKLLFNFLRLGLIHLLLPQARIIHCRRHPVDTCLSIYSILFQATMEFGSRKSDLVFYYKQYARLMEHWRSVLPSNRFLEVDYEAVISEREAQTRRLIAFTGLEWADVCLQPERNDRVVKTASTWQVRQPVYTRSVERWRRYEPWLGELRELLA